MQTIEAQCSRPTPHDHPAYQAESDSRRSRWDGLHLVVVRVSQRPVAGRSGVSGRSITVVSLAGRSLPGWPGMSCGALGAAFLGSFPSSREVRVCQRTDGGIVAGPRGFVCLPVLELVRESLAEAGGCPCRSDLQGWEVSGTCPVRPGEYGHRLRQAGGSAACSAGSRTAVGAVRCSWTQLDLMGHDPNLRCADQAHCGTTDATRTERGIHPAGNRVTQVSGYSGGPDRLTVKPSAKPTLVRTQHLPPQTPRSDPVPLDRVLCVRERFG